MMHLFLPSVCQPDQFTCNTGACVSMRERCNGKLDCEDGSDETECDLVIRNIGYNKLLVPSGEHETLVINVSIIIREVTI